MYDSPGISPEREVEINELMARGRAKRAERITNRGRSQGDSTWTPTDFHEATRDALLLAVGETVTSPHPLAVTIHDPNAPLGLVRAANIALTDIGGLDISGIPQPERILRAMGNQGDLPSILTEVAENIAVPRVNRTLKKLLAITAPMDVTSYHQEGFTAVDISEVPALTYGFETKELSNVFISGMGEPVQLASAGCLLVVSRQVIVNDDAGVVAAGVRAFAAQAAAKEAEIGFGLFAANQNLSDGDAWLSAGTGNLLTGTALGATGLGTALAALRDQTTESGTKCDADAAFLVVNGADEVAALTLADTLQRADPPLTVVASAHVPSTSWFVMADPAEFPAIARATMAGSRDSVWAENQRKPSNTVDGIGIRLNHAAGYAPVSRIGVVRVDKA